jgi:hypothetical protein
MKSTITENTSKAELPYPKLMAYYSESGTIVVLFTGPARGTVIHATDTQHTIGQHSVWAECSFTDFHGSVTLSNEEA